MLEVRMKGPPKEAMHRRGQLRSTGSNRSTGTFEMKGAQCQKRRRFIHGMHTGISKCKFVGKRGGVEV